MRKIAIVSILLITTVMISLVWAQTYKQWYDYTRVAQAAGTDVLIVDTDPNGLHSTKNVGRDELLLSWQGSSTLSTYYLSKATYDVSADGHADGNDVAYGAAWNADVNAPSMNTVYDEMETRGKVGGDNWTGTHDMNAVTLTLPSRQKKTDHHYLANLPDPNSLYAKDTHYAIDPNTDAAMTITDVTVTCDADPATEIQFDLKFADAFIGLAGATKICSVATALGVAHVTSFDDATIPANKCVYIEWTAAPISAITQASVKIRWDYD